MPAQSPSHVWLFATPWTVACQAPLSMEFSRQEHWSKLPFPTPGDLPDPGIELMSLELADWFFTTELPENTAEAPWQSPLPSNSQAWLQAFVLVGTSGDKLIICDVTASHFPLMNCSTLSLNVRVWSNQLQILYLKVSFLEPRLGLFSY